MCATQAAQTLEQSLVARDFTGLMHLFRRGCDGLGKLHGPAMFQEIAALGGEVNDRKFILGLFHESKADEFPSNRTPLRAANVLADAIGPKKRMAGV